MATVARCRYRQGAPDATVMPPEQPLARNPLPQTQPERSPVTPEQAMAIHRRRPTTPSRPLPQPALRMGTAVPDLAQPGRPLAKGLLITLTLLGGFSLALITPFSAASAVTGIEACANTLNAQGYTITSMDIDDGRIYDFEAIRNNHSWDIKTDLNCKVLIEQRDH